MILRFRAKEREIVEEVSPDWPLPRLVPIDSKVAHLSNNTNTNTNTNTNAYANANTDQNIS